MENSLSASITPIEQCAACNVQVLNDDEYCSNCGYPLKGAEQEQKDFILKKDFANIDIAGFDKRIKKAGNTLYYLAFFFIFGGVIVFFLKKNSPDVLAMILPNLILTVVFLVLGWYSRKKPLACIVSGLCLYIITLLLIYINNDYPLC
ncbi:MAG: hypothetical protein ACHQIM_15555 [Sphingobacteriales bacterium]